MTCLIDGALAPQPLKRSRVPALFFCRWATLRLAATPWVAGVGLALLGLAPLLQALSPLPTPERAVAQVLLWAPPTGFLGTAVGLLLLSRSVSFLRRLDPPARWRARIGTLSIAGLCLQLPLFAGACWAGGRPSDLALLAPAILSRQLLVASLALLLLRFSISATLRVALFLSLVWLLPPLLSSDLALLPGFFALLDARLPLAHATPAHELAALSASAALLLAGRLVRREAPSE